MCGGEWVDRNTRQDSAAGAMTTTVLPWGNAGNPFLRFLQANGTLPLQLALQGKAVA